MLYIVLFLIVCISIMCIKGRKKKQVYFYIGLRDMPTCQWCQQTDTIEHRITACVGSAEIWSWTRARIAAILRMDDRHIPNTWPFLPEMHIWPPQRHNAIIWMLGHMVHYTLTEHPPLKRQGYIVYIRRARWKIQKWHSYLKRIGK